MMLRLLDIALELHARRAYRASFRPAGRVVQRDLVTAPRALPNENVYPLW